MPEAPSRPHVPLRAQGPPLRGPVLLVIDSLDGGGAERYVVDLALALRGRGWPVEVACSTGGVRSAALLEGGIPVFEVMGGLVKRRVSTRYGAALRRLVRDRRPAVVHAHLYASAAAAARALRGTSVPLVVTEHTEAPWRGRRQRAVSRRVYPQTARIVAVSSAIRDLLVSRYGVPRERVEVLLPCTTSRTPEPALSVTHAEGPVVGVVGRLVPEKGVEVFLAASALVGTVVPTARFLVVGDGPQRADLERTVAARRLSAVTFTGFRPDAPRLIAGLDVLVVPSRSDGSPLVVCEAMAAGVPVVASRVGGLPDLVEDGGTGVLVEPGDVEELARTLVSLLLDPEAARRLGDRARDLAADRSHTRLVDRMTQIYAALAAAN